MNVIMKNICKEVPNDLALFSSFVLKKKVAFNLTVSLFKKYSYTNLFQKVLIILLENTYI